MSRPAEKFSYRCTSIVPALNYCSRFFFKSLSDLYEVERKTFLPIFWIFEICDRNFAKIVAPSSDRNENYVVQLKEQSLLKKTLQTASKSANKRQRKVCSNYAPLERTVIRTWSVTKKHFRTYSRRSLCDLPQDRFNRLDTIPACDRRTDGHVAITTTALNMLCVARVKHSRFGLAWSRSWSKSAHRLRTYHSLIGPRAVDFAII